jgi:primosomal protein N' (replication factor Y)
LHGITGSGKTLVYCHLARKVLGQNRGVLVLTPEIALSGTALAYFRGFFGDTVTVIHSAMTGRERLESWTGIRRGKYRVVIGPRSALFAPLENLALVIVDEEHDSSYKQNDPSPRFHGRDAAVMRGKLSKVPILLGSASPSLESYHHARSGRYRLLELTERPSGARLPKVRVINMQQQKLFGDMPYLSFPLKKEVDTRLARDEQVILFLNRRGYAPQLKCADCGFVPRCPRCDVKLTYHRVGRKLSCHYCGHFQQTADSCPACSGHRVLYLGAGTQKVETHLAQLFRSGRVLRFDSDTASGRKNAHQMLREFSERNYNLLLGTQMVTKGLDFPGVSLVGVLSADLGLDLPDFRASEKTFARLLQVAGRSGRGQNPGEVFIQTYYPESEVIRDAAAQDFVSFYKREIESRRTHRFPPFNRLLKFILLSQDRNKLEMSAAEFGDRLRVQTQQTNLRAEILGPAPCPMALLRGNFRRQLFVKTRQPVRFSRMLSAWEDGQPRFGLPTNVKIVIDVDPDDMM